MRTRETLDRLPRVNQVTVFAGEEGLSSDQGLDLVSLPSPHPSLLFLLSPSLSAWIGTSRLRKNQLVSLARKSLWMAQQFRVGMVGDGGFPCWGPAGALPQGVTGAG